MSFPLFFDEDQNEQVAIRLLKDGCDVLTTRDSGRNNRRLPDEDQLHSPPARVELLLPAIPPISMRSFADDGDEGRHHSGIIVVSSRKTPSEVHRGLLKLQQLYPDGIDDLILPA